MFSLVHSPLAWGLLLVGLPVLIHLINLLRHRRIEWAAMEFLLASQRKNRTWILLKQLLLLLLRMAVVAAIVLAVAQPLLRNELGALVGGATTHHVILLDDSYSMSDRWADTSAWDQAKRAIGRLGEKAAGRSEAQVVTLLRFSQAGRDARCDFFKAAVDREFPKSLADALAKLEVSQTSAGPHEALAAVDRLLGKAEDENRIVYLLTDFRARQWERPDELRAQLARLDSQGTRLQLVDCAETTRPNLTISELSAVSGTQAAGVPLFMEVGVTNHGPSPVGEVAVALEEDGHPRPAVKLEGLPPGETARGRFQVVFPTAGEHRIAARLSSDAVAADNVRYHLLNLPADVPVLLVDGSPGGEEARYLSAALATGPLAQTGIRTRIETPRFLSLNPLDGYASIYLANVERLDESALESLAQYVAGGGGLAIFLGPSCRAGVLNEQWYRQGRGILPMPVAGPAELVVDRVEKVPDLDVGDHPVFRIFAGRRNTFLNLVNVERYFAVAKDWKPEPGSATRVIARLRNGAPLAVERNLGEGRVIALTTTAGPLWNNWARGNPSFAVAMQDLQAYLARQPAEPESRAVGVPLEMVLDAARYRPSVRLIPPGGAAAPREGDASPRAGGTLWAVLDDTSAAGFYEVELTTSDGLPERRTYAVNVDPDEGDLARVEGPQLAERLTGVRYRQFRASDFQTKDYDPNGYNLGDAVLYLLVALLVVEQLLAYSCSYHPPLRLAPLGRGGAG